MKFIGKLFVIAALLAGFNIQPVAYAIPSPSEGKALNPSGKTPTKGNVAPQIPAKTTHDKTAVIATVGNPSDDVQNQININSADAEQLAQSLNGIGRKKAEAIVNYREQFGFFTDAEQLLEVPGIGPSFLEKNSGKLRM
ncbi:ComEA family DNA-binding protein [Yersinia kristensenii]|uniref:Transporter n=1 Tax=Yersinia kristensenii TaxID=28152 RepID=A0AB73QN67_YERKR|nr:ComEA family DNA-binding protein [Yersinia kristensenii]MDA5473870.1 ComEA family DNA-binding protein [Yersinia kristensenii]MDA5478518.1 ComEA family DNA-binding protein [Yersinia kristensenii]MDA5507191.1 ComEA family DNA-binding protein [Yersinia kristensenii]MDA5524064.1 ComEA family DNA-binding protein [Yersinia kristensenii]MDR4896123.1 ComEA family DNA-binding protein [Yersinia kristensenii]